VLVELEVVRGDRRDRRGHRLLDVRRRQGRAQSFPGLAGLEEQQAHRLTVGRRRRHAGEFVELAEHGIIDGQGLPLAVAARLEEELPQSQRVQARSGQREGG
jgi:hypothetical protein